MVGPKDALVLVNIISKTVPKKSLCSQIFYLEAGLIPNGFFPILLHSQKILILLNLSIRMFLNKILQQRQSITSNYYIYVFCCFSDAYRPINQIGTLFVYDLSSIIAELKSFLTTYV